MRKYLFLNSAQRFSDFTFLLFRVFIGIYLMQGVWPEITDAGRMQNFVSSLATVHRVPVPELFAPLFAYLTIACGTAFILGLFTRWAGIVCALVAFAMIVTVKKAFGMPVVFPSLFLLVIGLYMATYGAGRFSVDQVLRGNDLPRPSGGVRFKV